MRRWIIVPVVVALAGSLTGCRDGADRLPANDPAAAAADQGRAAPREDPPATVAPDAAATMTIADVLRTDERFSTFREIAERVETPIAESGLAVWDWDAGRMGDNQDGVTVFVPTDAAFEALDPAVLAVIEDPQVDNSLLYSLVGHHYIHRLYPSDEFVAGGQATWRRSVSGKVHLTLDPLTWGGHPIEQTDLRAANGYIHVVGGVVIPDAILEAAGS